MRKPPLGELEQDVLRHFAESTAPPLSVRAVAEAFREERGLARTTILTVMENLRKKGYLTRSKAEGGLFLYRLAASRTDLLQGLVRGFVENTLGGSVSPLVAYLADNERISGEDLIELERFVDELRRARREEQPT